MVERNWGDRLAAIHPTLMALLLAALAWPIVALTLDARVLQDVSRWSTLPPPTALPADDIGRWAAAAGAVFASALMAAPIGAALVRRNHARGVVATFLLAAIVGCAALPVLPTLLDRALGLGYRCGSVPLSGLWECRYALTNPIEGLAFALFYLPLVGLETTLGNLAGPECWSFMPSLLTLACGVCLWVFAVWAREGHEPSQTQTAAPHVPADASRAVHPGFPSPPPAGTAAPGSLWPPPWRTWRWSTRVFAIWTGLAALSLVGYFLYIDLAKTDVLFGVLVGVFPMVICTFWLLLAVPGFTVFRFFRWLIPPLVTGAPANPPKPPPCPACGTQGAPGSVECLNCGLRLP